MEAASFGQAGCVSLLVAEPTCELDAVNIRGQTAAEVAAGRGHSKIAETLRAAAEEKENPEEVRKIRNLEEEAEKLKVNLIKLNQTLSFKIQVFSCLLSK